MRGLESKTIRLHTALNAHCLPFLNTELEKWSRQRDLNSRPTVYETVALPLSYVGTDL